MIASYRNASMLMHAAVAVSDATPALSERPAGLVGRPIAFEETLGHHPQKTTRILAVCAFFIDGDFDMRRA